MYEEYKSGLGWSTAAPLEQALIEIIALTWLRLTSVIDKHQQATQSGVTAGQALAWERIVSGAQRRFLQACESLARVRRMGLPSVSVRYSETRVEVSMDDCPTIEAQPSEKPS